MPCDVRRQRARDDGEGECAHQASVHTYAQASMVRHITHIHARTVQRT